MFMLENNVGLKYGMVNSGRCFSFYYRKNRAIHKIEFYFASNIYGATFVTIQQWNIKELLLSHITEVEMGAPEI